MQTKETSNPIPSVERIQELCKFIRRPLNNQMLLINPIAPMVTYSGIVNDKEKQAANQKAINDQGLTLVREHADLPEAVAGDRIVLGIGTQPTLQKVITTDDLVDGLDPKLVKEYNEKSGRFTNMKDNILSNYKKKYLILFVHPMNAVAIID